MNGKLILDCLGEIDEFHINEDEYAAIAKLIKVKKIFKYSAFFIGAFLCVVALAWVSFSRRETGGNS